MLRVLRIENPSTIVVARDGAPLRVTLSGIEITDPSHAQAYLEWSLPSAWVMIEDGRVYRSPDALCINDDLVRKGFARSTNETVVYRTPVTYLGELNPERAPKTKSPARRARAARPSRRLPRMSPARATRVRRRA